LTATWLILSIGDQIFDTNGFNNGIDPLSRLADDGAEQRLAAGNSYHDPNHSFGQLP